MDANKVNALAESVYGYAVETRRRFHEHPELSNQEHETTHYIISQLEEMGIPYLTPAPTGVIAVIQGAKPGKVLGIRADIEAHLPACRGVFSQRRSGHDGEGRFG